MHRDSTLTSLLAVPGRASAIARAAGVTKQAVSRWSRVPAERALTIAAALNLPPWQLRPDLWAPPVPEPTTSTKEPTVG